MNAADTPGSTWSTRLLALLLGAGCWLPAHGQETDPVFELGPFEVVVEDDNSYLAKNAVSATKFNTALKDIPISLQVMTESFMDDTFSTDLEAAMEYAAAVNESVDQGGTRETGVFSIRGFRIDRVKRDGVISYYGQDMTNIARVEVMKGPASLLYGQTEPGGIINYVPKRPFDEPRYSVKISGGSDGFFRGEMEATGPLLKNKDGFTNLVYRLDASYEEEDGWKFSEQHRRKFISPVLEWRFTSRAKLTFQYEKHDQSRMTQHGLGRGSRFAREQWLAAEDDPNNPNDLKSVGSFVGGASGYMVLTADTGLPILVSPDTDDPTKFKLSGLPGVQGDPRWDDGNGYLKEDSAYFVFNPETASSSPVVLVIDEFIPVPYDFTPEHPDDFNDLKRDFYSMDFQTPLPWDGWFFRAVGVWDNPSLDIKESRHLPLAAYSGDAVRYSRANFSSTFFENKLDHYQVNITGKWEIGPLFNQTIIGGEWVTDSFRNRVWADLPPPEIAAQGELVRVINGISLPYLAASRIYDIENSAPQDRSERLPSTASLTNRSQGYYVSNLTSVWKDQLKVLLGLRYGRAYTRNYEGNSAGEEEVPPWSTLMVETDATDKYTPQYGLIYSPKESLSFYVSYSESFWPTSELLETVNEDGTAIEPTIPATPFEGVGKEAGVKIDLMDSRISGTLAYFEIERKNIITREPSDDPRFPNESVEVQGASETSKGIDLDLIYTPIDNLQLVLGYAYIESEVALGVSDIYEDSVGVPDHNLSLWSKYTATDGPLDGLSAGLGINYLGDMRLLAPLRQFLSRGLESTHIYEGDYLKLSAMLSYETELFGNETTLSLNVKNLTDKRAYTAGGRVISPRQVYLSVKYAF
jgi:outer membrane receptor for ferric coprogen and ferric-rhodotorulic acid